MKSAGPVVCLAPMWWFCILKTAYMQQLEGQRARQGRAGQHAAMGPDSREADSIKVGELRVVIQHQLECVIQRRRECNSITGVRSQRCSHATQYGWECV